jgi:hypothetical protein
MREVDTHNSETGPFANRLASREGELMRIYELHPAINWRRRALLLTAVVSSALVGVAATAPSHATAAASQTCGSDCHGATRWDPAVDNTGAIAFISTSRLSIVDPCTQTAYNTLWEGTANSVSFADWIENGIHVGMHFDGTCGNGVQFYWADKRPGHPYEEHYTGGAVGFNQDYAFRILHVEASRWEVARNGSPIGYSDENPCCSLAVQAGAESHQDTVSEAGRAFALQKRIDGSWSYNWTTAVFYDATGFFALSGTPPSDVSYSH